MKMSTELTSTDKIVAIVKYIQQFQAMDTEQREHPLGDCVCPECREMQTVLDTIIDIAVK